jgi:hypothetical protein
LIAEGSREHLRTALELVCEYLDDDWGKKLMEHLGVTEVRSTMARAVAIYVGA